MVKVKIKKLSPLTKLPLKMTPISSGFDVYACIKNNITVYPNKVVLIPTGFSLEIPEGYEAQIRPRSGLAAKYKIGILNSPGTIDADYRGEVKIILINYNEKEFIVKPNMRIAQMVFLKLPKIELEEVDELEPTERNYGGFGHTGIHKD